MNVYDLEEICPYCDTVNSVQWDDKSRFVKCSECGEIIKLCCLCDFNNCNCSECE